MLFNEAVDLQPGDELFYGDGPMVRPDTIKYLAGPFDEGNGVRRVWKVAALSGDGILGFYSIQFLEKKPRIPVVGETWIRKSDSRHRYVDGVTDKWVIVKQSQGAHNSRAYATLLEDFQKQFRPV